VAWASDVPLYVPFALIFTALFGALIAVELIAVKSKRSGDTITEMWEWIHAKLPQPWRFMLEVLTGGFAIWFLFHIAGKWR
jgi:hypothetical protein